MRQPWRKKWRRLPEKQKNQVIVLTLAVVVGLYAVLFYAPGKKELQFTDSMLNRQTDRLVRKNQAVPERLPDINALEQLKVRLLAQLEAAEIEAQRYDKQRVPIDSPEQMQRLRLGVTHTALRTRVELVSAVNAGVHMEKGEVPDAQETLIKRTENEFGRPQILLKVRASFNHLMDFLGELPDLEYQVAVVRLGMRVGQTSQQHEQESFAPEQEVILNAELLLTL